MSIKEKDKKEESTAISVLDNLKTSNLPELIGWREKQEKLVADNPYIEIVDNKTFEEAKKRRTALSKGRTELKNQDTAIASKLASFRKDVKSETEILIAITQPHEDKQQAEVDRYVEIKEKEKEEKADAEANRVKRIQDKLESIETESYQIIQSMVYDEIESKMAEVNSICSPGFDFEEYDVMYDQVVSRVETALESKVKTLTDNENQRLENIRLKEENEKANRLSELQSSRLTEIMPYVAFGVALDLTKLGEMDDTEYAGHLSSKKSLFEAKEKADAEAEKERLAKEEEKKDAVFEVRTTRLLEIGLVDSDEHSTFWTPLDEDYILLKSDIRDESTLDFEKTILDSKDIIEKGKKAKIDKLISDRLDILLNLGFKIIDGAEYPIQLSDKIFVSESMLATRKDDWFDEFVQDSVKHNEAVIIAQKESDEKLAKEEAAKMKAENKARIKKYAKDKNVLTEFVESLEFRHAIPELENDDLEVVVKEFLEVVQKWKSESIELINKY